MQAESSQARGRLICQPEYCWLYLPPIDIYVLSSYNLWVGKLSRDFGIPREDGIEIDVTLPVTMLADMLGAPRETTSRLCKRLADCGLIRMSGKRITVTGLEKMSQFYKTGAY